jgi:uncharacterized membrane protein
MPSSTLRVGGDPMAVRPHGVADMRIGSGSSAVSAIGVLLTIGGVLSGLLAFCGLVVLIWGLLDREAAIDPGRTLIGMLFFVLVNLACVTLDRRLFS